MKQKKAYVRVKDRRVGLKVKERPTTLIKKNSNQWVSDPRHDLFVKYWLTPTERDTFGNAYQSAMKAGFSTNHAKQITSNVLSLQWVKDAKSRLLKFNPEHIVRMLEDKALNARKDADSIRALEVIARIQGMFIDRSIQQIDVQFTNSVPRPVTDVEAVEPTKLTEGDT